MAKVQFKRLPYHVDRDDIVDYINNLAETLEDVLTNLDEENTTEKYEEEHKNNG